MTNEIRVTPGTPLSSRQRWLRNAGPVVIACVMVAAITWFWPGAPHFSRQWWISVVAVVGAIFLTPDLSRVVQFFTPRAR